MKTLIALILHSAPLIAGSSIVFFQESAAPKIIESIDKIEGNGAAYEGTFIESAPRRFLVVRMVLPGTIGQRSLKVIFDDQDDAERMVRFWSAAKWGKILEPTPEDYVFLDKFYPGVNWIPYTEAEFKTMP